MEKPLYTILDTVAKCTQHPFFAPTDRDAKDVFADLCLDKNSLLNKHPNDYELYRVGTWDARNMQYLDTELKMIASGSEFKEIEQ